MSPSTRIEGVCASLDRQTISAHFAQSLTVLVSVPARVTPIAAETRPSVFEPILVTSSCCISVYIWLDAWMLLDCLSCVSLKCLFLLGLSVGRLAGCECVFVCFVFDFVSLLFDRIVCLLFVYTFVCAKGWIGLGSGAPTCHCVR